jgi:hypothetical protein
MGSISDLYPNHVVIVHQLVLDCFNHADPCSVSLSAIIRGVGLMVVP